MKKLSVILNSVVACLVLGTWLNAAAADYEKVEDASLEAPLTVFQAKAGVALKDTLQLWAKQAGWRPVKWQLPADMDYIPMKGVSLQGAFPTVVKQYVAAVSGSSALQVQVDEPNKSIEVLLPATSAK